MRKNLKSDYVKVDEDLYEQNLSNPKKPVVTHFFQVKPDGRNENAYELHYDYLR